MPLVEVKLIEGVFTAPQKQEVLERLTEARFVIEGENLRQATVCLLDEVKSGYWAIGGTPHDRRDSRSSGKSEGLVTVSDRVEPVPSC